MSSGRLAMAVRHPKRGKAHMIMTSDPSTTRCGRWTRDMTETVPVEVPDPADRCSRCFPY